MKVFQRNLYDEQVHAIYSLITDNLLLLSLKTVSGKSTVMQVTGCLLRGITLVIVPLLVLGTDQGAKFDGATPSFGQVLSVNLDQLKCGTLQQNFRSWLLNLPVTTTHSIFLFASPQTLDGWASTLQLLLERQLLRFITIDEVYLVSLFGMDFRDEFRRMKANIIGPFMASAKRKPLLIMSATLTPDIIAGMDVILGVRIPNDNILWAPPVLFMKSNIKNAIHLYPQHGSIIRQYCRRHFKPHLNGMTRKVIIYSNSRAALPSLKLVVESELLALDLRSHVVQCDGECFSEEKDFCMKLFNGNFNAGTIDCRALVAISGVACSGIDICDVTCILRHGFPPSVVEWYQELGRCGRHPVINDVDDEYILMIGLDHLNFLLHRIFYQYSNGKTKTNIKLREQLKERQRRDLLFVMQILFLDYGCQHARLANALGNPTLSRVRHDIRCGACSICTSAWHEKFLKVDVIGVKAFLGTSLVTKGPVSYQEVVSLLWKDKKVLFAIYHKSSCLSKYNVEGLILQLVAAGILEMYIDDSQPLVSDAQIRVPMDDEMSLKYCSPHAFRGIHCFPVIIQTPTSKLNKRIRAVTPSPQIMFGGETGAERVAKLHGFHSVAKDKPD